MHKKLTKMTTLATVMLTLSASVLAGCSLADAATDQAAAEDTVDAGAIAEDTIDEKDVPQLNYALGIEQGIYGWTLSEDGSFYILSMLNSDGTMKESTAADMGFGGRNGQMGQAGEDRLGDGQKVMDGQNAKGSDFGTNTGQGEKPSNGDAMNIDPLAMESSDSKSSVSVNAQGLPTEANITNEEYQSMLVFVPAAYMTVNEDGSAVFTDAQIGSYTANTAPIVFQNSNGGWKSGSPKAPEYSEALEAGMIYVSCGSRSRDAKDENGLASGKAPTPVVDLKAGVIALRANADVIPGDKNKIISVGASGGGQMSSILGASGNMDEYYPYLYEAGAIGISYDQETDTYSSSYDDSVYADMAYCPIADIENADLAYAWMRYDSTLDENGNLSQTAGNYEFSEFELALEQKAAYAFAEYINSLELKDEEGQALCFDLDSEGKADPRSGSYYERTLSNISDALNAFLADNEDPDAYVNDTYGQAEWLKKNDDGTYSVTDLAGFITGTGLVRNKDIPGFDAMDLSAENDAFGAADTQAVHYSASIAGLLQENYDEFSAMEGFDQEAVDQYIEDALTGETASDVADQTYLMNATQIMLNVAKGAEEADIAQYWRTRNGTADQHTSFSVAYDICLAAQMAGADADYALVWNMGHGSNEGNNTGTFVDWIREICN